MKRSDRLKVEMTIPWTGKSNRKYFLKHLIETHSFKTIAEVGVRDGRTTFFLLDNILDLTIYAIDMNISGFYNKNISEKYKNRLIAIEATSEKAASYIPDNSLDLVFIDANHSYPYVKTDIVKYTPKLKSSGLLTGHDIDYPGVNQAVNELIKDYDIGPNYVWIKRNKT